MKPCGLCGRKFDERPGPEHDAPKVHAPDTICPKCGARTGCLCMLSRDTVEIECSKCLEVVGRFESGRKAERYIRSLRSGPKRAYAEKYLNFFYVGGVEPEPEGLGYMGAQAVRMRIADLLEGGA